MMHRFFIENIDAGKGNVIIIGDEFHHLKKVLRLNIGEDIIVFDGKGNDFIAKVETIGSKEAQAGIQKRLGVSGESKIKIVLAQGIAKGEKMDFIIQKATELGAAEIIPFITSRTVPRFKEDDASKKVERWRKIAIEASKQCKRSIVPIIEPIKNFSEMMLYHGREGYLKFILWEDAESMQIKDKLRGLSNIQGIVIIVGPEGGFSKEEIQEAEKHGFIPTRLFKNILRTETAGIAVLSIINYEIQD